MSKRRLIDVTDLVSLGAGDPQLESDLWRELRELADDLNSDLDRYEVRLVHLDTADYLEFIEHDPTEGAYWRELEEERHAMVDDLFGGEQERIEPAERERGANDPRPLEPGDAARHPGGEVGDVG